MKHVVLVVAAALFATSANALPCPSTADQAACKAHEAYVAQLRANPPKPDPLATAITGREYSQVRNPEGQ
jgi:hypothetical protein